MYIPGQPLLLQGCVSRSFPVHSLPPNNACVFARFLSCVPPPQVTEQVSHALHAPHEQFTVHGKLKSKIQGYNISNHRIKSMHLPGQPLLLQSCDSKSDPVHSLPPNNAS